MIACWLYKKVIAHRVDVGQALPASAQRHLENCAACRRVYELERAIARRLVDDAEKHRQMPSPFLHARIMASIDRQPQNSQPAAKFLQPIWAAALVIIAIGSLSMALIRTARNSNPAHQPATANFASPARPATNNASAPTERNVLAWSKAFDQPLEAEM